MKHLYPSVNKYIKTSLALLLWQANLLAQASGSQEVINGYMAIATGGTHATACQNLYIGPGTYLINGTWEVYSKNIWISPAAIISGSGIIRFYNPSTAGGTASASLVDGNNSGNFITVNISQSNASNMVLTDNALPATLTAAGWADVSGNASLSVGKKFGFSVANGNALIGNYDMTLSSTGSFTGYKEDRFVVTAGSGHLVKQNYTGAFIFPVGMAAGDYTPAQITNTISNTMHVNVTNYSGVNSATFATAITAPAEGINRGWNIYAGTAAGNSTIDLEHNDSTNGAFYNDNISFVTRLVGTIPNSAGDNTSYSNWESNNQAAGTGTGTLTTGATISTASERSRAYTTFATAATDDIGWYSKSSNLLSALPVTLVSFYSQSPSCGLVKLNWVSENEQSLQEYAVEQSADGVQYSTIGTVAANNRTGSQAYSFMAAQYPGLAYYRLKIKDNNGKYSYSKTITATMDCSLSASRIYPVPFSSILSIVPAGNVKIIQVMDVLGRVVITANNTGTGGALQLDGSKWAAGTYLVQLIKTDGTTETIKAVKN